MNLFETLSKAIKPQEGFERPDAFDYKGWTCVPDNDYFVAGAYIDRTDWTVWTPDGNHFPMIFHSSKNLKLYIDHVTENSRFYGKKN